MSLNLKKKKRWPTDWPVIIACACAVSLFAFMLVFAVVGFPKIEIKQGNVAKASEPNGFVEVSSHDLPWDGTLYELRNKRTGCYYAVYSGDHGGALTPMFGKDGKPYCR